MLFRPAPHLLRQPHQSPAGRRCGRLLDPSGAPCMCGCAAHL